MSRRRRSQASLKPDRRGLLHADLHGMPVRDEETGEPQLVDVDGVPIEPDDTESRAVLRVQAVPARRRERRAATGRRAEPADSRHDGWQRGPANGTAYPGHRRRPGQIPLSRA